MNIKWADGVSGMDNPAVNNVLKIIQRNDIISFAGGLPSARSFPIKELAAAFQSTLLEEGAAALQYGVANGYEPLRSWIAARLQKQGINCKTGNVIITNGSQQVLDLACRLLVNPGDAIAVENPTYLAAIQVFKGAQARLLPIPVDEHGMDVDELAKVLEYERPKLSM
jgi:2-aminoadipate transaminase